MKGILREDMYLNFLTLHIAITILVIPIYVEVEENIQCAHALLWHFVKSFEVIYRPKNVTYKCHNQLNLCDDDRKNGPLENFSSFRFKNSLTSIKRSFQKNN